jgi:hypothetical protein
MIRTPKRRIGWQCIEKEGNAEEKERRIYDSIVDGDPRKSLIRINQWRLKQRAS